MDTYTGTEIYMAPEVIKGESYTHKIDIYSFSILAYELITSTFPFPGYNTAFLIQKAVLKGKRPDLSLIPDETIRNLLSKCWSEKPKLRPDFSEIVDIIKSDNFKKAMKADKIEVENYLCRFDDEPAVYSFIFSNGKICSSKFLPSMKAEEVLKVLQKEKRYVEDDSYFVFHGRVVDKNSTLFSLYDDFGVDDNDIFYIQNETPDLITVELQFQNGKSKSNKFEFIRGAEVFNVRFLVSRFGYDVNSFSLESNGEILNDDETLKSDTLVLVDKWPDLQYFDGNDAENDDVVLKRANGLIRQDKKDPKNKFIFKFKYTNDDYGDEFELSLPKNATVEDVKEIISTMKNIHYDCIFLFIGNQELVDFQKLAKIKIPKKVNFFKIYLLILWGGEKVRNLNFSRLIIRIT